MPRKDPVAWTILLAIFLLLWLWVSNVESEETPSEETIVSVIYWLALDYGGGTVETTIVHMGVEAAEAFTKGSPKNSMAGCAAACG